MEVAIDHNRIKKIARSGSASRVYVALDSHPEGLTLDQIADICNLKLSTLRTNGVRSLFNAHLVEKSITRVGGTVYRLVKRDFSVAAQDGTFGLENIRRKRT